MGRFPFGAHACAMDNKPTNNREPTFAHIVLFRCPESGEPIAAAAASGSKSLEDVDSYSFPLRCNCGWFGTLPGIARLKNWVEEWSG
jgi:hypothetical protein